MLKAVPSVAVCEPGILTPEIFYPLREGNAMALFSRIGTLFRGFLSLFISGIEERNPEALMEAARQEFRGKMVQYNLALARMAGVAERLKNQVKGKAGRVQELERRILANHHAGNVELAGSLARELQE